MTSQSNQHRPTPVSTTLSTSQLQPTHQEPFHDTLIELSAALAILQKAKPQLKDPGYPRYTRSPIRQLGCSPRFDIAAESGVDLSEILLAFALVFSKSRKGGHVVASVIREQPLKEDASRSLVTVYLTTNNGYWPENYEEYRKKWENSLNDYQAQLSYSGDMWESLIDFCNLRMAEYVENAKDPLLGIREKSQKRELGQDHKKVLDKLKKWDDVETFLSKVQHLLAHRPGHNHRELLLNARNILLKFSEKQDSFDTLHGCPSQSAGRLIYKCIDNLAKIRRAYLIIARVQRTLTSRGARLKIEFLGSTYAQKVGEVIDELVSRHKDTRLERYAAEAKSLVKPQETTSPHCEIQMLQHFSTADRNGVWNMIGCSKRPCYVCAGLLEASDFTFHESHGKAYYQYFLSAEKWLHDEPGMIQAIQEMRDEAVRRVKGYTAGNQNHKNVAPDSPVLQAQHLKNLRRLEISPQPDANVISILTKQKSHRTPSKNR
ncbi:hypothetical protein F5Y08DRAFT_353380 [Xylaria arbuscula]|uniref:Uncharacterized protein n=1 Tax=Xylaria arbuscula TaxID=114810 RepID=A0A9W8N6K6_9PEZI|nr:hypothetical protein F5Y08DRAFT_353380 [Xylaria arbuscula]KAJ3559662.1 hypothetical protein NPX13_g9502 [Xylaria arbuscula]